MARVRYLAPRIQQPVTKVQIKKVHKFYDQLDSFYQKLERNKYSSFIKLVQICQKSHKNLDSQFWSFFVGSGEQEKMWKGAILENNFFLFQKEMEYVLWLSR